MWLIMKSGGKVALSIALKYLGLLAKAALALCRAQRHTTHSSLRRATAPASVQYYRVPPRPAQRRSCDKRAK